MNELSYFNIFIKVVCFYHMYLYNGLQARYGVGALWLPNGPVYTPTPKIFLSAAHCTGT
jgi:hypothetical protein